MTDEVSTLRTVAAYQFGSGAGRALVPDGVTVTHTSSGRPRQLHVEAGRLATYGTDGRFTLGVTGGRRLQTTLGAPRYRVVVGDESRPYVADGRNAFAKFVREVDPVVRPGDEVLVEHEDGDLLAVGRARLSGAGMESFGTGVAVAVREGVGGEAADRT
ncbi:MAG: PUA domain-containing protein [Haloarculaceae archaeon]